MKILIDTTLKDLLILLIDNEKIIDKIFKKDLIKKSDELPSLFDGLLNKHNLKNKDIEKFYVTKGPGSFMGIRAGLLYFQTMAAILDIEILACDTLKFIQQKNEDVYIDAKSNSCYGLINGKYSIKENYSKFTIVDYDFIEKNIVEIMNKFEKINPYEDNSFYMKEPRIG